MSDRTAPTNAIPTDTKGGETKCICQVEEGDPVPMHDRICFKCEQTFNIEMTNFFRRLECGCGNNKFIGCCGYPPYICDTCSEEGWIGIGGDGGKNRSKNTITGEEKWERGIDIANEKKWEEEGHPYLD